VVDKDTTKSINKIRARAIQVTIYATSTNVFLFCHISTFFKTLFERSFYVYADTIARTKPTYGNCARYYQRR